MSAADADFIADVTRPSESVADTELSDGDPQLLRIARLGQRLFDAAKCVITLGNAAVASEPPRLLVPQVAEFCEALPISSQLLIVGDLRGHSLLGQHSAVTAKAGLRFMASQPVFNHERQPVGRLTLLDCLPRAMPRNEDRKLLADLGALVGRELQLRSMDALQIELQRKNKSLRRKSLVDPLIGTWNRGAIMRILEIEAKRCEKNGLPLALIVADLDYFKRINDSLGHPAGDAVLIKVASRLRSCVRPQEALGRYGGEEFLIVLPGASHQDALGVAERMRSAIASQPEDVAGQSMRLTISAGVASTEMFPEANPEDLISLADKALYAAKDGGRNRVVGAVPTSPVLNSI